MTKPLHALRLDAPRLADEFARIRAVDGAALPLPVGAPGTAIRRMLSLLRPATLTETDTDGAVRSHPLPDPLPVDDDVALVVSTSGSTGSPKGVALTASALDAATRAGSARLGCRPGDRWILALPLHHVGGIQVLLRSWALGSDPILVPPEEIGRTALPSAGYVSLVPTQLRRLLDREGVLPEGPTILLGGAAAEPELLDRARGAGLRVVTSYGMTETCGGCVYDGIPLDGVELRLAPDGRVQLRGPTLFGSYLHDPEATAEARTSDGWFTTRDLGQFVDGRLEVTGRADEVVVTGGENVPLAAVSARLREHPQVLDAAALGIPDPEWGQRLVAVVVPADVDAAPSLAELRRHVLAEHPGAYAPRDLRVVAALPRDAMGKITREALRRIAGDS